MIISLLETVGIEVVACYLYPSDLLSIGLTSRQLHNAILVPNVLIKLCIQYQLPIQLGVSTNYLVEFIESHSTADNNSHRSKRELVTYVLKKLHSSQLLLVDTNSIHESEERAKKLLVDEDKSSVSCYAASDDHRQQTTTTATTTTATVECHFQSNPTNISAIAWIDYILNRDACKRYGKDVANNKFIRDWLMLILASLSLQQQQHQQHQQQRTENVNSNNIQIWRWGCKHSNLSGKGVSGVGVTIISSSMDDEQQLQIELRLTRLY